MENNNNNKNQGQNQDQSSGGFAGFGRRAGGIAKEGAKVVGIGVAANLVADGVKAGGKKAIAVIKAPRAGRIMSRGASGAVEDQVQGFARARRGGGGIFGR